MKAESLTNLVKDAGISLNAASLLAALVRTELAETVEYPSTTGSGEVKSFVRLTETGLSYGLNKPTMHEFKTDPRFFAETFPELLHVVHLQIGREINSL
ncbi:hypothetical protein FG152_09855 [Ochrobactrum sp. XJ1]|nr:hypothetical protein [Ochrobactrum sp. XJ1]